MLMTYGDFKGGDQISHQHHHYYYKFLTAPKNVLLYFSSLIFIFQEKRGLYHTLTLFQLNAYASYFYKVP